MSSNEYKYIFVLLVLLCVVYLINKQVKNLVVRLRSLEDEDKKNSNKNNVENFNNLVKKNNKIFVDHIDKIVKEQDLKILATGKDIVNIGKIQDESIQKIRFLIGQRDKDQNLLKLNFEKNNRVIDEIKMSNKLTSIQSVDGLPKKLDTNDPVQKKKIIGKINNEETTFYQGGIKKIHEGKEFIIENDAIKNKDLDDSSVESEINSISDDSDKIAIYSNDNEDNNFSNSEVDLLNISDELNDLNDYSKMNHSTQSAKLNDNKVVSNPTDSIDTLEPIENNDLRNESIHSAKLNELNDNNVVSVNDTIKTNIILSKPIDSSINDSSNNDSQNNQLIVSGDDIISEVKSEIKISYNFSDLMKKKLNDLQCIAEENNIDLSNNGKKKTKKELALEISSNLEKSQKDIINEISASAN